MSMSLRFMRQLPWAFLLEEDLLELHSSTLQIFFVFHLRKISYINYWNNCNNQQIDMLPRMHSTWTHYPDSNLDNICSYLWMLCKLQRKQKQNTCTTKTVNIVAWCILSIPYLLLSVVPVVHIVQLHIFVFSEPHLWSVM